jgi:glycosidase
VVLSHIGKNHWWMKDLPTPDWVNFGGKFVPTQHHRVAVQDKYAAKADAHNFTAGWFVETMPDMNQTNPLVANYLIQNNIWWIEYAGLSGLRIDTYSYSDGAFLAQYTKRLMDEYPRLNMVGEEWSALPPVVARWQRGKVNHDGYTSSLPSLMDFPMVETMRGALSGRRISTTSTRCFRSTTCIRSRATWSSSAATTTWRACSASPAKTSTATA